MELKQEFILKCLRQYNEEVIAVMQQEMDRLKVNDTGAGRSSLAYKIFKAGNTGAYSHLSFEEYLRMVDMGVGRGHPLGGLKTTRVALESKSYEGDVFVKDNTIRRRKIYASIAYGKLPYLTGRMLYGFGEDAIRELKKELQTQPQP